jgi:hypothetical protein
MLWNNQAETGLTLDHYDVRNLFTEYSALQAYEAPTLESEPLTRVREDAMATFSSSSDVAMAMAAEGGERKAKKVAKKKIEDITEALCELERYLSLPPTDWEVLADRSSVAMEERDSKALATTIGFDYDDAFITPYYGIPFAYPPPPLTATVAPTLPANSNADVPNSHSAPTADAAQQQLSELTPNFASQHPPIDQARETLPVFQERMPWEIDLDENVYDADGIDVLLFGHVSLFFGFFFFYLLLYCLFLVLI